MRPKVLKNAGTRDKSPPKKRLRSITRVVSPRRIGRVRSAERSGHLVTVGFSHKDSEGDPIWLIECRRCYNKFEMPLKAFEAKEKMQCDGCTVRDKLKAFDMPRQILFEIYRDGRRRSEVILEAIDVVERCTDAEVCEEIRWIRNNDAGRYDAALKRILSYKD